MSRARAAKRGAELLELFGLGADGSRRIGTYSLGMRRRLDIATSLLAEPTILFLDEPTAGLDPQSRRALWGEIRRLHTNGVTVFLTTQYLEEADQLAERVAIIDNGAIIAEGSPAQLKREHGKKHVSIAAPVSAAQLDGRLGPHRVSSQDGRLVVELDDAGDVDAVIFGLRSELGHLDGLTVADADLEDVFMRLTGTAITLGVAPDRDGAAAS
jgi:ABC-2 type transport system ATP-binding protein